MGISLPAETMKGLQLCIALVVLQQAAAHTLNSEDGPVDLNKDEFCTDVSQYSPKYYEDEVETCCTTVYEPNCKKKVQKICMDVTNTICKPFAKPNYNIDSQTNPGQGGPSGDRNGPDNSGPGNGGNGGRGPNNGNNNGGRPDNGNKEDAGPYGPGNGPKKPNTQCALDRGSVDLNACKPKEVILKHIKKVPHCENKTSLNCETGWKVVNGQKVWSGEEDCEEVTWQDCKLVDKEVDFPALESVCSPSPSEEYAAPANRTVNVKVPMPNFEIVQKPICEAVTTNECVDVPYDDCSEPIRKEECREFRVRKPKQDFIHKKKCLLPQDIERLTGGSSGY